MDFEIQFLHFFSGPGRFAQEFQARLYAWILDKTVDANQFPKQFPAKVRYQPIQYGFETDAMQRIVFLSFHTGKGHIIYNANIAL